MSHTKALSLRLTFSPAFFAPVIPQVSHSALRIEQWGAEPSRTFKLPHAMAALAQSPADMPQKAPQFIIQEPAQERSQRAGGVMSPVGEVLLLSTNPKTLKGHIWETEATWWSLKSGWKYLAGAAMEENTNKPAWCYSAPFA